jgi:hypothetical protein
MSRVRLLIIAVFAVTCVSAVAATGAYAKGEGKICTTNTGECVAPTTTTFTGESAKEGLLETTGGSKIACTKTKLEEGKIASSTSGSAKFKFTGCKSVGLKCSSSEFKASEETIVVKVALTAQTESAAETGKDFLDNSVTTLAIKCGETSDEVKGCLLIPVGAAQENVEATAYTFAAVGSKGAQTPALTAGEKTQCKTATTVETLSAKFGSAGVLESASLNAPELKVTFTGKVTFR